MQASCAEAGKGVVSLQIAEGSGGGFSGFANPVRGPGNMLVDAGHQPRVEMGIGGDRGGEGGGIEAEIQSLKNDYVRRGGRDSSILEAIVALEQQARSAKHGQTATGSAARGGGGGVGDAHGGGGGGGGAHGGGGLGPRHLSSLARDHLLGATRGARVEGRWGGGERLKKEIEAADEELRKKKLENASLLAQVRHVTASVDHQAAAHNGASGSGMEVTGRGGEEGFNRSRIIEEEELRNMELNPQDTAVYRLRKKHLLKMVTIKYDLELLRQTAEKEQVEAEVELMKKEGVRREWLLKQQEQLLHAKYRKHMARENPTAILSSGQVSSSPSSSASAAYNSDMGLALYLDFVIGIASHVAQVQIVYSFYEGSTPKTEVKALPQCATERTVLPTGANYVQSVVAIKRAFQKVFPSEDLRLVLEVQQVRLTDNGPRTFPLGWGVLPLFGTSTQKGLETGAPGTCQGAAFNHGLWVLSLFYPPARMEATREELEAMKALPHLKAYCRLVSAQPEMLKLHDSFIINPETTKHQYAPVKFLAAAAGGALGSKQPGMQQRLGEDRDSGDRSGGNQKGASALNVSFEGGVAGGSQGEGAGRGSGLNVGQGEGVETQVEKRQGVKMEPGGMGMEPGGMGFVKIMIDGFSGSLLGHPHCEQRGGGVYVRVSVRGSDGPLQDVVFSKHPDAELSTGLNIQAPKPLPWTSSSSQAAHAHLGDNETETLLDDSVETDVQLINRAILSNAGGAGGSAEGQGRVKRGRKGIPFSRIPSGSSIPFPRIPSGSVYEEAEAGKGGESGAVQRPPAGEVKGSWCSGITVITDEETVDVRRSHLKEGVCISFVPVGGSSWLVLQVFLDLGLPPEPPEGEVRRASSAEVEMTPRELRQEADARDILVGWATFPLFESDAQLGASAQEQNRIKTGKFMIQLAAPPLDTETAMATMIARQQQQAQLVGRIDLLRSHDVTHGNVPAELHAPLPHIHIDVAAVSPSVALPLLYPQSQTDEREGGEEETYRSMEEGEKSVWRLPGREDAPWLPVPVALGVLGQKGSMQRKPFILTDGFDLYVDGARYLPDHVSLTTVEAFCTDSQNNVYGRLQKDIDVRSRAVNSPVYNGRKEFRASELRPWQARAFLVFRIDGIEHVLTPAGPQRRLGVVGFSAINLFKDASTGLAPNVGATEFVLNAGAFQLSVHRGGVPEVLPLTNHTLCIHVCVCVRIGCFWIVAAPTYKHTHTHTHTHTHVYVTHTMKQKIKGKKLRCLLLCRIFF